jgi:hypothetical protein
MDGEERFSIAYSYLGQVKGLAVLGGGERGGRGGGGKLGVVCPLSLLNSPLPLSHRPSLRTHYRLTRREVLRGAANRFVHSTVYLYFYGAMALASTLTVVLSLWQPCPGALFYGLELAINVCLIAEVGVRGVAFGKVSSWGSDKLRWANAN